jgi:hypothetical protein
MEHSHYPAGLLRLHGKHRQRQSRCAHDEILMLADDTYEGERQDCYQQGAWPTVQSKELQKGKITC